MHYIKLVPALTGFCWLHCLSFGQASVDLIENDLDRAVREGKLVPQDIGNFLKFKYSIESQKGSGVFNKNSSSVFIRKLVWDYQSLKVREMFSLVYEDLNSPPVEKLVELFSTPFSIGGLQLESPSETQKYWRIRFKVDVPVNSDGKRLRWFADTVSLTSDSIRAKFEFKIDEATESSMKRGDK
jgi:hypothetical protein